MKLTHVWSCELEEWKRRFLRVAHGDVKIYEDVMHLGERQDLEQCDWFWAGFSCRSTSGLNKNRSVHSDCVATATGTTGGTFSGISKFLEKDRPHLVALENVKTIGRRNLESVMKLLQNLGYLACHVLLDSKWHGLPQSRPRIYFLGILAPSELLQDSAKMQKTTAVVQAYAEKLVQTLVVPRQPLGRFLLDESTSYFRDGLASVLRDKTCAKKTRSEARWVCNS